jgi:predicted hotdog family 3-hydroxylacyl-ACP dehydratase
VKLDRAWLAAHLPHQGRMNLLDAIVAWDETRVRAVASGHRDERHPLRDAHGLPAASGIEYAAQAAAAHGALVAGGASGPGVLASVRGVRFHVERLDDVAGDLEVSAEQLGAADSGVLYRFEIASRGRMLVDGRLAVAFLR